MSEADPWRSYSFVQESVVIVTCVTYVLFRLPEWFKGLQEGHISIYPLAYELFVAF